MRRRRSAITTFVLIFLAEWGDLTQVLTVNLAARLESATKQYRALKSTLARLEKLSRQAITRLAKEVDSKPRS